MESVRLVNDLPNFPELQTSSRYLSNVKKSIDEGKVVQLIPLTKITSRNLDISYTRKITNLIRKLLPYVTIIQFPFVGMALNTCFVKLVGHLPQFHLFCRLDLFHALPIVSMPPCVLIVWYITFFYESLCNRIHRYICSQSYLDCKFKFYNQDVDHINKCLTYLEEHPNDVDLNAILLQYIVAFEVLFKWSNVIGTRCFVETIEQQVEEVLVSNGKPDNIESNQRLLSIFPKGDETQNQKTFLYNSIKNAESLMSKINSYCIEGGDIAEQKKLESLFASFSNNFTTMLFKTAVFVSLFASMFVSFNPLYIIGLSIIIFIFTIDRVVGELNSSKDYKEIINLLSMGLKDSFALNNFEEHVKNKILRKNLLTSRSRLYTALEIKNPEEGGDLPEGIAREVQPREGTA